MRRLAFGLFLALASAGLESAPSCKVDAQPRITLPPLRYMRIKVTIERDASARGARLMLLGPDGEETASDLHTDVRTQWVEWKNLVLGAGNYEVVLQVSNGCIARSTIQVGEPDGPPTQ